MNLLVVSPHLDDAVFACGGWLAAHRGATVVTVFAGTPADARVATEWDRRCGFADAGAAMHARREEDREALALLGARPHWLPFCDAQYGPAPPVAQVTDALEDLAPGMAANGLLFPLGLFHSDHLLVHDACLRLLARKPGWQGFAYEDALYRHQPGLLQERLAALLAAGWCATPVKPAADDDDARARKAEAVGAYRSQLRAFGPGGYDDTALPERRWRLQRDGGRA